MSASIMKRREVMLTSFLYGSFLFICFRLLNRVLYSLKKYPAYSLSLSPLSIGRLVPLLLPLGPSPLPYMILNLRVSILNSPTYVSRYSSNHDYLDCTFLDLSQDTISCN